MTTLLPVPLEKPHGGISEPNFCKITSGRRHHRCRHPTFAADIPEACNSYQAAVTGGLMPPADSETVVIRWLGNANYEFAYKGKVYLFDTYFDRTPRSHKLGFAAADVKKAEAIFVSHAHFDHISDIGPVSRQTGAPVIGAPLTAEMAKKLGTPESQIVGFDSKSYRPKIRTVSSG